MQNPAPGTSASTHNESLVRELFRAFHAADRAAMEKLLHTDFHFTSPYDDHINRTQYFERCWPHSGTFRHNTLRHILTNEETCFVEYVAESGDGTAIHNVEKIQVKDGQIISIDVFFGGPANPAEQKG